MITLLIWTIKGKNTKLSKSTSGFSENLFYILCKRVKGKATKIEEEEKRRK